MTQSQRELLETLFRDSYNYLAFTLCDSKFRRITNVQLQIRQESIWDRRRRLQQSPFQSNLPQSVEYFTAQYQYYNATTNNATNVTADSAFNASQLPESNFFELLEQQTYPPRPTLPNSTIFEIKGVCRSKYHRIEECNGTIVLCFNNRY